jgi:hypothetical protein
MMGMDDDVVSIVSFGVQELEVVGKEKGDVTAGFFDEVESAQRLAVLRNQAMYINGRMEVAQVSVNRPMTPEKVFNVPKVYKWTGGEPVDLLKDLSGRTVRARAQANMGVGKSTRFASLLADGLGKRVLVVSLDAHALRQTSDYIRAVGIGKYRRSWSKRQESRVCCMTYADYCAHNMTERRGDLYRCFDVHLFDEAFEAVADVFAAKRAFAAYAHPSCSILLCSATISTDVAAGAAGSGSMGGFSQVDVDMSVQDMIASGKLVGDYLVDKSYVVVPRDVDVVALANYYMGHGVSAYILDSASSYEEFVDVCMEIKGDSVSPRVVVMHYKWAIAFNMELEFGIVVPRRGALLERDGVWQEVEVPMTEEYVMQAKARTGRGIGDTSGGMVVGASRMESCELYATEVERAFFLLLAMYIKPNSADRWVAQYRKYPDALPPCVAYLALKVNLPPSVVVKFVAEDGLIARKYARAVSMFTQMDHFIMPSAYDDPKEMASWVMDDWLDEGLNIESRRVVPVHAVGELQCVLHGIVAVAEGELEMTRWRPRLLPAIGDGYDSDSPLNMASPVRLRKAVEKPLPEVPRIEMPERGGFRLDRLPDLPADKRSACILDKTRMREALEAMERSLISGKVVAPVVESVESEDGKMAQVEIVGVVNSPGGSVVCELPVQTYETMNEGRALEVVPFMDLLARTREIAPGFVGSRLFDGFAGPWESFLRTACDPYVLAAVRRSGEWSGVYTVVERLRARFDFELVNVLVQSNVTRSLVAKLFGRGPPRPSKLVAEIAKGKFDRFGQSKGFFRRVQFVRALLDRSLVSAEEAGCYLPNMVSQAQRSLRMGLPQVVGAGSGSWHPVVGARPLSHDGYTVPMDLGVSSWRPGEGHRRVGSDSGTMMADRLRKRMDPSGQGAISGFSG